MSIVSSGRGTLSLPSQPLCSAPDTRLLRRSPNPACDRCAATTARIAAVRDRPDARRLRGPEAHRTLQWRPTVDRSAQPHTSPPRTVERQAATARLRLSWPPWRLPAVAAREARIVAGWQRARTAQHDHHQNDETDRESVQERDQEEHLGVHRTTIPSLRPSREKPPPTKASIVVPGPTHRSTRRHRITTARDEPRRGSRTPERGTSRAGLRC
jgi:hypothetical protein